MHAQKSTDDAAKKQHVKDMLEHYTQGCNKRDAASCRKIGVAYIEGYGLPKAAGTAVVWFERALKLAGDPIAMRYLGLMKLAGAGTAIDASGAIDLLKRACAAKDEIACKAHGSATSAPAPK
jgi:TPR repeat protein